MSDYHYYITLDITYDEPPEEPVRSIKFEVPEKMYDLILKLLRSESE